MEVVKQSTLQKMLFTDNGFEVVEDKDDLEKRINFSKSLLKLQFTGHGMQGYEFTLFDDDTFSDTLYNIGFRVYKDYSISSLSGISKESGKFRNYFYNPSKDDFTTTVKMKERRKTYDFETKSFMVKWPYKITLSNKFCYYTLYFKTEEDCKHFEKELYPKYRVNLLGGKIVYCKNCGNFTFLTPPLQYHYRIKEKEQFYFKLGYEQENGVITRLWVDKVVFFVDNLKISVYEEEVLKEDKIKSKNNDIFTVQYNTTEIKVKKEEVE